LKTAIAYSVAGTAERGDNLFVSSSTDRAMPFIKICGLESYNEAKLALDCGATALGFLVGLTHLAEDKIDVDTARDIVRCLPSGTNTVLVTHLTDASEIAALADAVGTRSIQVHGDVSPNEVRRLAALSPRRSLIKAVHVTGQEAIAGARGYTGIADALVLDSRTNDRLGGTGRTHDWSISRRIVEAVAPMPVYLAGGLGPANVAEAIAAVRPAGVDVNSGVENSGAHKDAEKLRLFVTRALAALRP
jgi:phosphoribosylanthranilate isomerase